MTDDEANQLRNRIWLLRDHKRRSADLRYGETPEADRLQAEELELCRRLNEAGYSLYVEIQDQ